MIMNKAGAISIKVIIGNTLGGGQPTGFPPCNNYGFTQNHSKFVIFFWVERILAFFPPVGPRHHLYHWAGQRQCPDPREAHEGRHERGSPQLLPRVLRVPHPEGRWLSGCFPHMPMSFCGASVIIHPPVPKFIPKPGVSSGSRA